MLTYLHIRDFALIESLELEPGPGLTVLTGETGAGKSIILAAVELLTGQRARSDLVRAGAEAAVVEAQFAVDPGGAVARRLRDEGIPVDDELVIRRVVGRGGRGQVRVNGTLATVGLLAELGPRLISLCGQHAQQELLAPAGHLLLLDDFAGLASRREEVERAVGRLRGLIAERGRLQESLARREERRAWLSQAIAELEEAELDPEEEGSLKAERRRLVNAEQIATLARGALEGLYAAEEGSALETLGRVRGLLNELTRLDPDSAALAGRLEELYYQLEDLAGELRGYLEGVSFDPGRRDWVEARLHQLQRLTRKYGGDVPAALAALEEMRRELAGLEAGDQRLEALEAELDRSQAEAVELARELSQARRRAAGELCRAVEAELAELGLAACRFRVEFTPPGGAALDTPAGPLGGRGLEGVEFHIAPNPGEGFRPLRRIASGGELSRILLALRGLVASRRRAPTQVFDEVDAGIGGATGGQVGRRLARLAAHTQVIVITHLPQIAAFAQRHYSVRKHTREGRTLTRVEPLDREGRLAELERMLAGPGGGDTARRHARRLLAAAREQAGV